MPQPYLVPGRPTFSRIAQSSGVSGSTSTLIDFPLIVRFAIAIPWFISSIHRESFGAELGPESRTVQINILRGSYGINGVGTPGELGYCRGSIRPYSRHQLTAKGQFFSINGCGLKLKENQKCLWLFCPVTASDPRSLTQRPECCVPLPSIFS